MKPRSCATTAISLAISMPLAVEVEEEVDPPNMRDHEKAADDDDAVVVDAKEPV